MEPAHPHSAAHPRQNKSAVIWKQPPLTHSCPLPQQTLSPPLPQTVPAQVGPHFPLGQTHVPPAQTRSGAHAPQSRVPPQPSG